MLMTKLYGSEAREDSSILTQCHVHFADLKLWAFKQINNTALVPDPVAFAKMTLK